MEPITAIIDLIENEPVSALVAGLFVLQWLRARTEQKEEQNTGLAITLASTIVTTFDPIKDLLQELVILVKERDVLTLDAIGALSKKTDTNHIQHEQAVIQMVTALEQINETIRNRE